MGEIEKDFIDSFSAEYGTDGSLIKFLIKQGLIKQKTIRNYQIIKDYYVFLKDNNGIANSAVLDLSVKYDMSERQVYNIIYTYRDEHKEVV